jgi:tetratricopeptide (TPR) repeat protein
MTKTIIFLLLFKISLVFGQTDLTPRENYNAANQLYGKKSYDKVIEITTKSLNTLQTSDTLYEKTFSLRVLAYLKVKDFDKAIVDYKKLIDLNPNDLTYYVGIGLAYSELKDFKNCYIYLDKGFIVNSKDKYLLYNTARFHNIGKDYNEAVKYANMALELKLEPDWRSTVLIERSKSYTNQELYENALKDCNESISLSPKNNLAYYYRAFSNIGLNKLETVCADLEKAKNFAAGNLTRELIKKYCNK